MTTLANKIEQDQNDYAKKTEALRASFYIELERKDISAIVRTHNVYDGCKMKLDIFHKFVMNSFIKEFFFVEDNIDFEATNKFYEELFDSNQKALKEMEQFGNVNYKEFLNNFYVRSINNRDANKQFIMSFKDGTYKTKKLTKHIWIYK